MMHHPTGVITEGGLSTEGRTGPNSFKFLREDSSRAIRIASVIRKTRPHQAPKPSPLEGLGLECSGSQPGVSFMYTVPYAQAHHDSTNS